MKWPLVSRKAHDAVKRSCDQLATALGASQEETRGAKATLANMHAFARSLESKLHDATEPPISSEDLRGVLKRLSFLQSKCDALEKRNTELEARVSTPDTLQRIPAPVPPRNNGTM